MYSNILWTYYMCFYSCFSMTSVHFGHQDHVKHLLVSFTFINLPIMFKSFESLSKWRCTIYTVAILCARRYKYVYKYLHAHSNALQFTYVYIYIYVSPYSYYYLSIFSTSFKISSFIFFPRPILWTYNFCMTYKLIFYENFPFSISVSENHACYSWSIIFTK